MLELLEKELQYIVERKESLNAMFAKLVLTQITLNGRLFKAHHLTLLNTVLDLIRRVLIEDISQNVCAKAFLLMTLDLYHSNFTTNALIELQKVYGVYLVAQTADRAEAVAEGDTGAGLLVAKKQKVDSSTQTEVAAADVFRSGPTITPPNDRIAATMSVPQRDSTPAQSVQSPSSPSTTKTPSVTPSKIDPRIRSVKIGRIYPSPVQRNSSTYGRRQDSSSEDEVARLSMANLMAHDIAQMKENRSSHMNRIKNDFLDRIIPPSEMTSPNRKTSSGSASTSGYCTRRQQKSEVDVKGSRYTLDEDGGDLTFDVAYFEEVGPINAHAKSFLKFLEGK